MYIYIYIHIYTHTCIVVYSTFTTTEENVHRLNGSQLPANSPLTG